MLSCAFGAHSGAIGCRLAARGQLRKLEGLGKDGWAQRVADADADANAAQDQLSSRRSKQEHDTLVDLLPHFLT